jgi:hypothetical protein
MKIKLVGLAFVSAFWVISAAPAVAVYTQIARLEGEELRVNGPVKKVEIPSAGTGLKEVYVFNPAGKLIERSSLYRSNERVYNKKVNSYDTSGRKTDSKYYAEIGSEPSVELKLRLTTVFKYDDSGNVVEELEYNGEGKLSATTVKKSDPKGNVLEVSGKIPMGIIGLGPSDPAYLREFFKYDDTGRLIEKQSFLADVKVPLEHRLFEYNAENRLTCETEITQTYPDKLPRIAKHFFTYNKQGDVIEMRYYEPVRESNVEELREKFQIIDDKGTVKNGTLVSDRPFMILWSVSVCDYTYDLHGNWTGKTCKWKMRDTKDFVPAGNEVQRIITYYQ